MKYLYIPNGTFVESDNELSPVLFKKVEEEAKPKARRTTKKAVKKTDKED